MRTCVRCKCDSSNEIICSGCGMFVDKEAILKASKDETLSVIREIRKSYVNEIADSEKRIVELDRSIRNTPTNLPKYTRIRYLWPFFIIGVVVMFIVAIISLSAGLGELASRLLMLISLVATILVGVAVAGSIQDRKNSSIFEKEEENIKKKREATRERDSVNEKIKNLRYELKDLSDIIPLHMLNEKGLRNLESRIVSGEALNLDEAVNFVGTKK